MAGTEPSITTGMRQADSCVSGEQPFFIGINVAVVWGPPTQQAAKKRLKLDSADPQRFRQARTADALRTHYEMMANFAKHSCRQF